MSVPLDCLIAFTGGAVYEAGCVVWVHYSERGMALKTAMVSMLCATAQVAGIGESVRTLIAAPFFIFGWGFGTYFAVKLTQRLKAKDAAHPYRSGPDRG